MKHSSDQDSNFYIAVFSAMLPHGSLRNTVKKPRSFILVLIRSSISDTALWTSCNFCVAKVNSSSCYNLIKDRIQLFFFFFFRIDTKMPIDRDQCFPLWNLVVRRWQALSNKPPCWLPFWVIYTCSDDWVIGLLRCCTLIFPYNWMRETLVSEIP